MKKLIITMGDPGGVGPELCARVLENASRKDRVLVITGDVEILMEAFKRFGSFVPEVLTHEKAPADPGVYLLASSQLGMKQLTIGKPSREAGEAAIRAIDCALRHCLDQQYDAMVTAPVSKEAIAMNGLEFDGHTGYISKTCGKHEEMMLMHSEELNVGYVTTHIALSDLPQHLKKERIVTCLQHLKKFLDKTGDEKKKIGVCGLNPHAGENGLFGTEDRDVIGPAVADFNAQGGAADGPLPADTLFVPMIRKEYGAILAMYHDQGGIPFKMLSFETGVNTTLGLPIVRTSVDHGTAWDLAWKGKASVKSMQASIELADRMSAFRGSDA